MDPRYARPSSPGSRRLGQPARSSTGSLIHPTSLDPYHAPTRTSWDSMTGPWQAMVGRGPSGERMAPPSVQTRGYRTDALSSRRAENDYVISPRRLTLDPMSASRQPLRVVTQSSPNRNRPVVSSAVEKPSGSFGKARDDDQPYLILPASSSRRDHQRNYSADATNIGQYLAAGRDDRERRERGGYRSSGIGGGRQGYNLNVPLVRQPKDKDDKDLGYEYTDRREQVFRDTAPRPRQRRGSDIGRRERPLSMAELGDHHPPRIPTSSRDARPPVSTRGFNKIDSDGNKRTEYIIPKETKPVSRDGTASRDRDSLDGLQRSQSTRASVVHQEPSNGYSSHRDERKDRHGSHRINSLDRDGLGIRVPHGEERRRGPEEKPRHRLDPVYRDERSDRDRRHRDEDRSTRDRDDDRRRRHDESRKDKHGSSKVEEEIALGAGGLAAAGLVAEETKRRHRREKDRERRHKDEPSSSLAVVPDSSDNSVASKGESDEERRERRRRRKEREARERREVQGNEAIRDRGLDGERDTDRRRDDDDDGHSKRSHRPHRHHQRTPDEASYSDESESDDGRGEREYKPSQLRVVSPAKEKEPEIKPKGILRPPREKFPEDPAPIREGVAPLKDAGKKGVPPNARWTKIDRKLVNPEALELGNERYEERVDYVIVLRVLTKEEIEAYAMKTAEIRDQRIEDEYRHHRLKEIDDAERRYERGAPRQIEDRAYDDAQYRAQEQPPPQPTRERQERQDQRPDLPSRGHQEYRPELPIRNHPDTSLAPNIPSLPSSIAPDPSLRGDPSRPESHGSYQRMPPPQAPNGNYQPYPSGPPNTQPYQQPLPPPASSGYQHTPSPAMAGYPPPPPLPLGTAAFQQPPPSMGGYVPPGGVPGGYPPPDNYQSLPNGMPEGYYPPPNGYQVPPGAGEGGYYPPPNGY